MRYLAVIGVILAVLLWVVFTLPRGGFFLARTHTDSNEIVDIDLCKDVRLQIPKAYLILPDQWKGGSVRNPLLEAKLPDMSPIGLGNAKKVGFDDRVMITVYGCVEPGRQFENTAQKLAQYLIPTGFESSELSEQYFEDVRIGKAPMVGTPLFSSNVHYFGGLHGTLTLTNCEKNSQAKCNTTTDVGAEILISYSASRNFFPKNWRQINEKVSSLILSFKLKPN